MLLGACTPVEYAAPALPLAAEAPALYAPVTEAEYRLQVGDSIAVRSYFDPQVNQEAVVRPDGRISLLLIGDLRAAGLTPEELASQVRGPYRRMVGNTDVTVTLLHSSGMSVYLSGEVRTPAMQPLEGDLTLLQALARSGGTLPSANTSNVLLIRNAADGRLNVSKVDVEKILRNESPDVFLHRRDVVYVPKSEIAQAGQFVDQYINAIVPRFVQLQLGWNFSRVHSTNPILQVAPQ
jgi:polysaccharide export outer membrane protein